MLHVTSVLHFHALILQCYLFMHSFFSATFSCVLIFQIHQFSSKRLPTPPGVLPNEEDTAAGWGGHEERKIIPYEFLSRPPSLLLQVRDLINLRCAQVASASAIPNKLKRDRSHSVTRARARTHTHTHTTHTQHTHNTHTHTHQTHTNTYDA